MTRKERTKDRVSGRDLSLSSLLVPSIEPDKGKRRLAFSSMQSLSFAPLSLSFTFLSVSPHLGCGPSTVCDPRPTFFFLHPNYHHYHRVSSHLLQPRAATFYFFLNFYYYYYFFFFFVVVIIDVASFFNSVSSSSLCFSSLIPLQTHASATRIDAPTPIHVHLPSQSYLANQAAPIRPRQISGTAENLG